MGYYILYGFLWVGGLLPLRILYFFSDIYFYLIYYLFFYFFFRMLSKSPDKLLHTIIRSFS